MTLLASLASMLVVLVGTAAHAQPREARRQTTRAITLKGDEAPSPLSLRVAPDVATLVLFDSPVARESVDTEALQGFFSRLEVNERSLVLKPAAELPANTALRITVRFADGQSPSQLVLALTSRPDAVDTQVEVRREWSSEARLLAELTELRGRCAATEAGLAPLRARCALAGLAGLFVSGEMDPETGVQVHHPDEEALAQGMTQARKPAVFRTGTTIAVGVGLRNPPGQAPWVAGPALLLRLGAQGQPLGDARRLPVTMKPERVEPGESALVAVQWEEPADAPASAVRLEVMGSLGRGLRWERLELQPPVVKVPRAPRGQREGP